MSIETYDAQYFIQKLTPRFAGVELFTPERVAEIKDSLTALGLLLDLGTLFLSAEERTQLISLVVLNRELLADEEEDFALMLEYFLILFDSLPAESTTPV